MRAISKGQRTFIAGCSDSRPWSTARGSWPSEVAAKHVLLVFQSGATEDDVIDARGMIPGHDGQGRLHLALSIDAADLEAWRERLGERSIAVEGEYRWPRGGTSLYFRDPDGALVELATPGLWW